MHAQIPENSEYLGSASFWMIVTLSRSRTKIGSGSESMKIISTGIRQAITVALLTLNVSAFAIEINSNDELQAFVTTYYKSLPAEDVEQVIRFSAESDLLFYASSRYSILSFLSGAISRHKTQGWPSLWLKQINGYEEPVRSILRIAVEHDPVSLMKDIPRSPIQNDMLWGLFFSTGDNRYVADLFKNASLDERGADINTLLTISSAKSSLARVSVADKKVRSFIQSELNFGSARNSHLAGSLLNNSEQYFIGQAQPGLEREIIELSEKSDQP